MQLIPTVEAVKAAAQFPPVVLGDKTISEEAIAAEMQFHPAESLDTAWYNAARSLVIRELLLNEAERLLVDATLDEEARIARVLELALTVPEPDESACRRFFEANPERFQTPTLLAVSHILLPAAADDVQGRLEQQATGEAILAQLSRNSGTFEDLARAYSVCESRHQGGSLGQISRGQTVPEFERVIWPLPVGVHNHLVESRYGWHLVRIDQRIEGRPLGYEQVRDDIRQYLLEQVTRRALRQFLQVRAAEQGVSGIDLELPDSPLLQ